MNPFLHYVLEAGVCLAFFYSVYWLFLKKETYFHLIRAYLVSSLLLSFIIPALNISSPFFIVRDAADGVRLPQIPSFAPDRSIDIAAILLVVYAAGVLLFLARLVLHLANLAGVVRRNGVRSCDGLKIVSIEKDFSPFSFLHFVFINSRNLTEVNLRHILAHEEVHIRQCHSLDILLVELVTIMQWFNPFVRPYKKALQETHEYLADFGVIAQGFSTAKYQLLMFEQHVGAKLFEFANNFKQSQIKRRITMMSKIKSRNVAKLKLLLVFLWHCSWPWRSEAPDLPKPPTTRRFPPSRKKLLPARKTP
jgi:beta-lactamase regulating signal transducer with metallopeptidase domain